MGDVVNIEEYRTAHYTFKTPTEVHVVPTEYLRALADGDRSIFWAILTCRMGPVLREIIHHFLEVCR